MRKERLQARDARGHQSLHPLAEYKTEMRLFSYIVTHDTGFSPNPFHGYCTLACCKPAIRRTAKRGDWVVGLTPKKDGNRIVYFMRVDENPLTYAEYWNDRRFKAKRPRKADSILAKCGDNIYKPQDGGYEQLPSMHTPEDMEHDLGGEYVLISETFAYFGSMPLALPAALFPLIVKRWHRSRFSDEVKATFLNFTRTVRFGVYARPRKWKEGDDSWNGAVGGCSVRAK